MGSRCTAWLLCLLIALLPLRGLAHGWMATGGGLHGPAVTLTAEPAVTEAVMAPDAVADADDAQPDALPPCHQAQQPQPAHQAHQAPTGDDSAASPGTTTLDGPTKGHACGLCDLCHSPLARAAEPAWALSAAPCAGPIALLPGAAPDAPGAGIFRPPRG